MSTRVIGIAGESGTGKSTVAAHLVGRTGGVHVDGDAVAHELLAGEPAVREAIRARFGAGVFAADGSIDRSRLGDRVFSDGAALEALNAIIHPFIRRRCGQLVEEAREAGVPVVVVDAALLLDSEMPFSYDLMIALKCDPDAQVRRLLAKGGRSVEQVRARLENQRHIENSFYKADAVVDTTGDIDEVLAEVDRIVDDSAATGDNT